MSFEEFMKTGESYYEFDDLISCFQPGEKFFLAKTLNEYGEFVNSESGDDAYEVLVLDRKEWSDPENYETVNGPKSFYLLEVEGEKFIYNDDFDSWGDSNPTLEKVYPESVTVYRSGPAVFICN